MLLVNKYIYFCTWYIFMTHFYLHCINLFSGITATFIEGGSSAVLVVTGLMKRVPRLETSS